MLEKYDDENWKLGSKLLLEGNHMRCHHLFAVLLDMTDLTPIGSWKPMLPSRFESYLILLPLYVDS